MSGTITLLCRFLLVSSVLFIASSQEIPGLDTETILAQLGPCATDLFHMMQLELPDSVIMIDAAGKNINSLGKYDECLATESGRFVLGEG